MGKASRDKGNRREREVVNMHKAAGVRAERVPLSGASRYQGNGADIDVYVAGADAAPWISEVKARGDGQGFATIKKWLGENDMLFLIEDGTKPLVLLPWSAGSTCWRQIAGRPLPRPAPAVVAAAAIPDRQPELV